MPDNAASPEENNEEQGKQEWVIPEAISEQFLELIKAMNDTEDNNVRRLAMTLIGVVTGYRLGELDHLTRLMADFTAGLTNRVVMEQIEEGMRAAEEAEKQSKNSPLLNKQLYMYDGSKRHLN